MEKVKHQMSQIIKFILLILILPFHCFAKKFRFIDFKRDTISLTHQYADLNKADFYGDKLHAFGSNENHHSKIINFRISDNPAIIHRCNDTLMDVDCNNQDEYLCYYQDSINLTKLLFKNSNGVPANVRIAIRFTGHNCTFSFQDKSYLLLMAEDRRFYRNVLVSYMVLLEVKDESIVHGYAFADTPEDNMPEQTPNCFGDFNKDGILDFLDWRKIESKISMFSLKDGAFVSNTENYIIVEPSKKQRRYMENYDDQFNFERINRKKSRWFYKL